jgi:type IV secretion system protein TrbL
MPCNPLDPSCIPGAIGDAVVGGAIDKFVEKLGDGLNKLFEILATTWFKVPSPDVSQSPVVRSLTGDLRWITLYIATLGVLLGLGRMAWELRATPGLAIARMIINLVAVSALGATTVAILVQAGDAFAPWIVSRATGEPFNSATLTALVNPAALKDNVAIGLILGLLAMLGTLAQIVFMIVRGAMLIILVALLPTVAAGSATEEGMSRLKKMLALLLGFILYKPVAAIIYAGGLKLLHGDSAQPVMSLLYGMTIIVFASLALPSVIKFFAPAAAMGSSAIFSGGAVAAAGVATGAAVVTLGGGAALAGAGAAGSGSAAGASGASGAAATGGTGAASGGAAGTAAAGSSGGSGCAAGGASSGPGASSGGSGSGEAARSAAGQSSGASTAASSSSGQGASPSGAAASSGGAGSSAGSSSGGGGVARGADLAGRGLDNVQRAEPEVDDGPSGPQGR